MAQRDAIAVYGRAPLAGRAKTRLARDVGAARAAAVYGRLLERSLTAARAVSAARYLYLPQGDRLDPQAHAGFTLRAQIPGDLGARMAATFAELFAAGHERVVLVGSDLPDLTAAHLAAGLAALADAETVFGPATDGGYWLVGQRPPARDLFSGVPWSTAAVWARTRERLAAGGFGHALLPVLEDVDDGAALARAVARGALPAER